MSAFTAAIVQGLGDYDVLRDNQGTRPIFKNKNLLTNIRKSKEKVSFDGIGGTVMTDAVGDFGEFGEVYYSDQVPANLLSYSYIRRRKDEGFQLSHDDELGTFTTVTPSGRTYVFRENAEGHYTLCADTYGDEAGVVMTVDDNKKRF
eukprot:gene2321-biopygen2527